jgi:hypothetical protein
MLRNLNDVKAFFASLSGSFFGVGMTAFSRIIPAYFLNRYSIVCLKKTRDIPLLRDKADIFCLEEKSGKAVCEKGFNSARLLDHPLVRQFLERLPGPKYALLYQSYPELETWARQEGWKILANPAALRLQAAERAFFKKMAADLHLPLIPGAIHPIKVIHSCDYKDWAETLGPRFVVQLPDIVAGGGKGTFFVRSPLEYQRLRGRLIKNTWRGVTLHSVAIHRFLEGVSASMVLCLTRQGVLFSRLQKQLIDLPYLGDVSENGVFCGHVWGEAPWPLSVAEDARKQARRIAEYLAGLGYRGVLGIDFLINEKDQRVFPLEINPRFTGALPMLSLLFIKEAVIPMEVFHILEFLEVPYQVDVERLNAIYKEPIAGSHMILFLLSAGKNVAIQKLESGLYEWDPQEEKISFIKGATEYREIRNDRQFIVVDGPPEALGGDPASWDPLTRLCRLLFPYPVVDDAGGLSYRALHAVDQVYSRVIRGAP